MHSALEGAPPWGAALTERHHWAWFATILVSGAALRLLLWSGYGLGDDPNFFICYDDIYRTGSWNPMRAYDFRFAFWVPVVTTMKLIGPGEAGFVGFVTLCSVLNLGVVYGLARQEWDRSSGLLAMALLAVFPLDVLSSTLFVIDIPLATYCFSGLLLYRAALRAGTTGARAALAIASGALLFLAYSTKQWAVLVGVLFAAEALRDVRRAWVPSAVCAGAFGTLVAAYFGWQWVRFGDPIYDVHLVRSVAIFEPHSRHNLLDYPAMLWLRNDYGTWFAGWYPHLLLVLAAGFALRVGRAGRWLAYFLLLLALLAAAPSHRVNGRWVILVPHIFRYLCLVSIPLALALTAYLREVLCWRPSVGAALVAALLAVSAVQAVGLTRPTRDAFGEMRRAVALLEKYPDERVWLDYELGFRFTRFGPADAGPRYVTVRSEDPAGRWQEFRAVREGLVVTGGGRLPWYGCHRCTANVEGFPLPQSWTLLEQLDGPRTPYRAEPLRIWRVSDATMQATQVLGALPDWSKQVDLLRVLVEKGSYLLAIEIGRRMALTATPPQLDEVLALTATACARASKASCARTLLARRFDNAQNAAEARNVIAELVRSGGAYETLRAARELTMAFQRRFPGEPDLGLPEVTSGFAEAVALYHLNRVPEAPDLFRAIIERKDTPPDVERKAKYFLGLCLFRAGQAAEGRRVSEDYRRTYGADESWAELRYRDGEAVQPRQPARAREIYAELIETAPRSMWAKEAHRQLARLPAPAAP
jgi:tetratricopeptide (TPR) repeat protein